MWNAFIWGYGWISIDNTTFIQEGKLHSDYNMPSIADCLSKFNVTQVKSEIREHLLYCSKGIVESPFFNEESNE